MTIWVDAQLSPMIAIWMRKEFSVNAIPLRDLGLRDASDLDIFFEARENGAALLTKDSDFILLLERLGPPPPIIWLTCGNTSNEILKSILGAVFSQAIRLLQSGERLVEINAN